MASNVFKCFEENQQPVSGQPGVVQQGIPQPQPTMNQQYMQHMIRPQIQMQVTNSVQGQGMQNATQPSIVMQQTPQSQQIVQSAPNTVVNQLQTANLPMNALPNMTNKLK